MTEYSHLKKMLTDQSNTNLNTTIGYKMYVFGNTHSLDFTALLDIMARGEVTDLTLYSPKSQQSVRQWKPFANDNEANALKGH